MKSYLLAYTVKSLWKDKDDFKDHFEVFCDGNDSQDNLEEAQDRLKELEDSFLSDASELYTWNIAEIIDTSEHYETESEVTPQKNGRE